MLEGRGQITAIHNIDPFVMELPLVESSVQSGVLLHSLANCQGIEENFLSLTVDINLHTI